jgi:single-strand DNA-binding protein
VEGRLQTRSWEGQDGQRRFRTEVVANIVLFLDRAQAAPVAEEGAPAAQADAQVDPDDLPFE